MILACLQIRVGTISVRVVARAPGTQAGDPRPGPQTNLAKHYSYPHMGAETKQKNEVGVVSLFSWHPHLTLGCGAKAFVRQPQPKGGLWYTTLSSNTTTTLGFFGTSSFARFPVTIIWGPAGVQGNFWAKACCFTCSVFRRGWNPPETVMWNETRPAQIH